MTRPLINSSLLAVLLMHAALADEAGDSFDDAFDDAFSDDPFADIAEVAIEEPSVWSLNHEISLATISVYNSDRSNELERRWSGLTSLQASYQPTFSYDPQKNWSLSGEIELTADTIFWLRDDENWSSDDSERRQYQADVHSLVAQVRQPSWQLSTGVQTVTLGLADALSVANILYGQNLAEPGVGDIDDTLQPGWTSVLSASLGAVRIRTGAVHRHQVTQLPVAGTDFYQPAMAALTVAQEPLTLANMGGFMSASGVVGALDWQLNGVSQLSHSPVVVMTPPTSIELRYPRQNSLSAAVSFVHGAILWKAESALTHGLQAQSATGAVVDYQRWGATLGADIDHATLGRLTAEVQGSYIPDYSRLNLPDSAMTVQQQTLQWALLYRQSWLRETLQLTAQMIGFDLDGSGGRMQGVGLEYELSDMLSVEARLLDYISGDYLLLQGADDRDRFMMSLHYRF